jgi:hypothetical protein
MGGCSRRGGEPEHVVLCVRPRTNRVCRMRSDHVCRRQGQGWRNVAFVQRDPSHHLSRRESSGSRYHPRGGSPDPPDSRHRSIRRMPYAAWSVTTVITTPPAASGHCFIDANRPAPRIPSTAKQAMSGQRASRSRPTRERHDESLVRMPMPPVCQPMSQRWPLQGDPRTSDPSAAETRRAGPSRRPSDGYFTGTMS